MKELLLFSNIMSSAPSIPRCLQPKSTTFLPLKLPLSGLLRFGIESIFVIKMELIKINRIMNVIFNKGFLTEKWKHRLNSGLRQMANRIENSKRFSSYVELFAMPASTNLMVAGKDNCGRFGFSLRQFFQCG